MKDPADYEAFRAFAKEVIARQILEATEPLKEEIRSLRTQLEIRSAQTIEGPPGKDGKDGRDGKDGTNGGDGKPGEKGERGADGIATREELHSLIEERMADINVRSFADVYQGVYEPDRLYTRGLATTWGGSLWLALVDTKAKPGENADWRLIVKKGADGRK